MSRRLFRRLLLPAAIGALLPSAAPAQTAARVSIGRITSEQSCTTYQMSSGRSSFSVDRYGATATASWRTWLQHDCVDDFATIRASLVAAIAASGHVQIVAAGTPGSWVLTGTIGGVGTQSSEASGGDFATHAERIAVNMNLLLRDPAGRSVTGGTVLQTLETGSGIQTDAFTTAASQDGRTLYTQLEQGLALRAARLASFAIVPLRVIGAGPDGIRLNYGAPMLTLGTDIQVQTPDARFARFRVVAAGDGIATAEPDGESGDIPPGSTARVIEADDPAANARRTRRVDLP